MPLVCYNTNSKRKYCLYMEFKLLYNKYSISEYKEYLFIDLKYQA